MASHVEDAEFFPGGGVEIVPELLEKFALDLVRFERMFEYSGLHLRA